MIHPFDKKLSRTVTAAKKTLLGSIVLLLALAAANVQSQVSQGGLQAIAWVPAGTAYTTNYHGWSNSVSINNGMVEAVIVPAVGRVQQFRFVGDTNGALWENPRTLGRAATGSGFYPNFGGDKAWPSPQSEWGWPPPKGFDGSVCTVSFTNGIVTLVTPVDATYGIRTTRIIELVPGEPEMRCSDHFRTDGGIAQDESWSVD